MSLVSPGCLYSHSPLFFLPPVTKLFKDLCPSQHWSQRLPTPFLQDILNRLPISPFQQLTHLEDSQKGLWLRPNILLD